MCWQTVCPHRRTIRPRTRRTRFPRRSPEIDRFHRPYKRAYRRSALPRLRTSRRRIFCSRLQRLRFPAPSEPLGHHIDPPDIPRSLVRFLLREKLSTFLRYKASRHLFHTHPLVRQTSLSNREPRFSRSPRYLWSLLGKDSQDYTSHPCRLHQLGSQILRHNSSQENRARMGRSLWSPSTGQRHRRGTRRRSRW